MGIYGHSLLSVQFCCEYKTVLKLKSIFLKGIGKQDRVRQITNAMEKLSN